MILTNIIVLSADCPAITVPAYECWYYTQFLDACNLTSSALLLSPYYAYCTGCGPFHEPDYPCVDDPAHIANCPTYKALGYCEDLPSLGLPYCTHTCGCFTNFVPGEFDTVQLCISSS